MIPIKWLIVVISRSMRDAMRGEFTILHFLIWVLTLKQHVKIVCFFVLFCMNVKQSKSLIFSPKFGSLMLIPKKKKKRNRLVYN